jgi:hypothetical protein
MNDLRENELLSAYLDGELTAAERTEVERLLAANPAARRLLDELRSLRAALQALPPQKLDEDLSRQVLWEARRRMLSEGESARPAPSAAAPVLMARSIFQRLVNRRTAAWLAITAAVIIMITINERQHRVARVDDGVRKVARGPAMRDEDMARRPQSPPSIQATPNELERVTGKVAAKAEKKAEPASPAAPAAASADKSSAGQFSTRNYAGEQGQLDEGGPLPAKRGRSLDKMGASRADKSKKKEKDEALLVVHCDISPEAARSEALDKLLDANGVVWYLDRGPSGGAGGGNQNKAAAGQSLVYAEATPAQLKAVLAGLEAQPEVFLSVSVGPTQDKDLADRYAYDRERRAPAPRKSSDAGQEHADKKTAKVGDGEVAAESPPAGRPAPRAAKQAPADQPQQAGPLAESQRQLHSQSVRQSVAKPSPRQQVLFVVRIIGRDQQPEAAKKP